MFRRRAIASTGRPARAPLFAGAWSSISGGTLSNANRQAAQTSSGVAMEVVSGSVIPSGKYYVEFACSDITSLLMAVGVAINRPFSGGNLLAMARSNATTSFIHASTTRATQASWAAGQIMMAIDRPNSKIWMGRNGTWFASGNPAADTNPYFSTIPAGSWLLACHSDNDGNGNGTCVLHLTAADQVHAAPSGFTPLGDA